MKKILVVVDMQKDFIDGSLGTKEAQLIVDGVVKEMHKDYDEVFLTRDTHQENYLETQEGRNLPIMHCIENTEGWMLDQRIEKALEDLDHYHIFNKPTFGSSDLAEVLKKINEEEGIFSITLCGLCTDICVVSNALLLKAAMPEVIINVRKELCAGVTPESHEAALTTMKMCQVHII